jgi:DNA-directed RNA polymerase specialized sigma subunit
MDKRLDQQLCELLKIALQNTEGSSKINSDKKKQPTPEGAAEALALAIDQLAEPKRYLDKSYLRYYEEALKNYTQPDVKKNIYKFTEKYQLNMEEIDCKNSDNCQFIRKKFINWIMTIVKADCIDIKRSTRFNSSTQSISINEQIGENFTIEDTIATPTISGLDWILQQELKQIARKLKDQIEEDTENRFRNCHIKNRQDGNCQTLIQLRYLKEPPLTLKETSEKLKIKQPTISNHIDKKCKDLLKKIAKELGYE